MARIGFVSLGCPKALVDSERVITRLRAEGYTLVPRYGEADLVVVNTCGFIESAVAESLEAIGEALSENGKVIVTGCLGQRAETIYAQHPQVLAVTGPHDEAAVLAAVHAHLPKPHDPYLDLVPPQGVKLTPKHYAYLKISEGCNHRCTFCIIPSLRGDLVSRPLVEIMDEAQRLVAAGVKELLVIAQDTSAYGVDRKYRPEFWQNQPLKAQITPLAAALADLGVWVRLHYVYPYPHVDHLIPLMAQGRLLPYLDMPLQHANPRILKLMHRPAAAGATLERLQRWRELCPTLTLRSTFIVGFPGETDAEFEELLAFLKSAQLDRVGCFTYSPVTGAAANGLPDPVPAAVKQARQAELMAVQAQISAARLRQKVGQRIQVLVDRLEGEQAIARSSADAPEIDGVVQVRQAQRLRVGEWAEVLIERSDTHDLYARPVWSR